MATQNETKPLCGPCLMETEYRGPGGLPDEVHARIRGMLETTASFLVTGGTTSEAFGRAVQMCGRHWRMAQTIARQRGAKPGGPAYWPLSKARRRAAEEGC